MAFHTCNDHQVFFEWYHDSQHTSSIVLIHSLGANSSIWMPVVERLKDRFNILTVDLRGHGRSNEPNGNCKIKDYASDVLAILDHLKIDRVVSIGLSLGGLIAQYLTIYSAPRIEKLIVSNSAPKIGDASLWNERIKSLEGLEVSDLLNATIARSFSQSFLDRETGLDHFKRIFLSTSKLGYIKACEALRDEDLRTETKSVKVPTLFIGGEFDQAVTPKYLTDHAQYIRSSKVHIIPNVGHLPCYENPDAFVEVVLEFIKK